MAKRKKKFACHVPSCEFEFKMLLIVDNFMLNSDVHLSHSYSLIVIQQEIKDCVFKQINALSSAKSTVWSLIDCNQWTKDIFLISMR